MHITQYGYRCVLRNSVPQFSKLTKMKQQTNTAFPSDGLRRWCSGRLNFFIPGGFERNISSIVIWFEDNK